MACGEFSPKKALTRWTSMLTTACRNKREKAKSQSAHRQTPQLLHRIEKPSTCSSAKTPSNPLSTSTQKPAYPDPDLTVVEPPSPVRPESDEEDRNLVVDMSLRNSVNDEQSDARD
jgi:hypothetical protein